MFQLKLIFLEKKVKVKAYLVEPELFGACPVYLLTTDIDEK